MILELVPVIGFYQAMILNGFSEHQIQNIISGSTYEQTT